VRSIGKIIALARERAINLPNPGRIEDSEIEYHDVVAEVQSQRFKAPLEEYFVVIIIGELNPVEYMCTIPAIGHYRNRPASAPKPASAGLGALER
jgi:hypothetical protein